MPVVLGGPHVSVVSEELDFESLHQPGVDLIVRGEGEADLDRDQQPPGGVEARPGGPRDGQRLFDPALGLWDDVQGISYRTSDGELHRNPDRAAHRRSGQPALAGLRSVQDGALHQPAAGHRCRGWGALLLDDDQPGLPLPLYLLLAVDHARQVARAVGRERAGGMAAPGARSRRPGDRRPGRFGQHPHGAAWRNCRTCSWPKTSTTCPGSLSTASGPTWPHWNC